MSSSKASTSDVVQKKMVVLTSSDGERFELDQTVAAQSETIKNMLEDCPDSSVFPVSNVTSRVMAKVIEYMNHYAEKTDLEKLNEEMDEFDKEFVKVDQKMLFDLIWAANYLNVEKLMNVLCKTVADMMKGKTPEQIRETFQIVNDYTSDEEKEVRKENAWAFE